MELGVKGNETATDRSFPLTFCGVGKEKHTKNQVKKWQPVHQESVQQANRAAEE